MAEPDRTRRASDIFRRLREQARPDLVGDEPSDVATDGESVTSRRSDLAAQGSDVVPAPLADRAPSTAPNVANAVPYESMLPTVLLPTAEAPNGKPSPPSRSPLQAPAGSSPSQSTALSDTPSGETQRLTPASGDIATEQRLDLLQGSRTPLGELPSVRPPGTNSRSHHPADSPHPPPSETDHSPPQALCPPLTTTDPLQGGHPPSPHPDATEGKDARTDLAENSTTAAAAQLSLMGPAGPRLLPRRLAVANQKGGVGKTTTAVNLGAALAEIGYRVLVVDLDPQGNATTGLGVNARSLDASIYDVILHDVPLEDVVEPTSLRNLFVVPATIDLAGAEIELVPLFSRELRLRRALDSVDGDYDYTLIDCPPSLGLLTVNGLAAASEVLVPIQCEYYALEGLGQLLRNVNLVRANLNATLEVSAIVLTMYDARTRLAEQVASEVRTHFGSRVCRNIVPRTVRLSEAPSFGQPIILFDPSSRGAIAYRELAKEVSGGGTS